MPVVHVTDPDDARLSDYRNLPDPQLLERHGIFVAEGRLVVRRLLTGCRLVARSVMVTESARASIDDVLAGHEIPIFVVPQDVMNQVAGFNIHRGCLAIGERPAAPDWRRLAGRARRLVIMERLGDADNVGSLFRNAAAFSVDAVLVGPACADPLYRKAIRTSMAATLSVPFATAEPWPDMLRELVESGFAVIALTPSPAAPTLRGVITDTAPRPTALLVGHEGSGLTPDALAACTHQARIPMMDAVDSINVATAAAIALYELSRAN
jgi:tRNA G18 (ribose-2'-O)-methylase SpoU